MSSLLANKKLYYVFLFAYFGFMAIPQWFRPFSPQFLIWFLSLPIILITLIVIGIWGIIRIWQTNKKKLPSNSKHITFVKISGAGILLLAIFSTLAYGTHFLYNHQKFNSDVWQAPYSAEYVSYDLTPRQRMLDDLVENVLPGSTLPEIEQLLGESSDTGYFSNSERDLIYLLGLERGFGIDSEWLLIWFDDTGNFERYDIFTD